MRSRSQRFAISFNGEIYNFRELRLELEAFGVEFKSESDTEILLEGYATWGSKVIDRLVGSFAFAIWDSRSRELFLARDRLGEKPLYYCQSARYFAFASEIQALTSLPNVDLTLDLQAVQLYLEHRSVPAPLSIYAGIRKLPAAHSMLVKGDHVVIERYWNPLDFVLRPARQIEKPKALEELDGLLTQSVKQQMVSDVPLGAFLSGGIDSSSVVSVMSKVTESPIQTFTIGFDSEKFSEAGHAQAVADRLGTQHTSEILRLSDAMSMVATIPAIYGEPFGDSSALPTLLVSRVARKSVTVCLAGDGGDELFGGYHRYESYAKLANLTKHFGPTPAVAAVLLQNVGGTVGNVARLISGGRERDEYRPFNTCFGARQVSKLTGLPKAEYGYYDEAWDGTEGLVPRRRAMFMDLVTHLPEELLVKVDRAAMSTSLEVRVPFLDHRLVEWSLGLPQEYVTDKRILREYVYGSLPRSLLERPKMGFSIPVSEWLRDGLRDQMNDVLLSSQMERVGITNRSAVKKLIAEHDSGRHDNGDQLWNLMSLSLWAHENLS